MSDDKKINLMPENLRGKEESFKVKGGLHLSPDLSLPGKTHPQAKSRPTGSDISFWSKLAAAFKPKTKKTIKNDQPSSSHVSTAVQTSGFEIPKMGSPIMTAKADDFKVPNLNEDRRSSFVPERAIKSGSGVSFWQKLAKFFQGKPKAPKIPKVKTKNGSSILASSIKKNSLSDIAPNTEVRMPKIEPKPQIFQDLNQQIVPAKKVEDILESEIVLSDKKNLVEPKIKPEPPIEPEITSSAPLKQNGFKIPETSLDKSDQSTSVESLSKFHQPVPRVKGRLLENGSGVDLIPTAARVRSWLQIVGLLFLSIVTSLAILILFYGVLYWQEQDIVRQQKIQQDKITEIEKNILNFTELNKNISDLGKEIKLAQDSLNKHIYWTNFFSLLEKYTLPDVFYSGLAVGNSGALSLSATASSYDSVAKQLKILEDPSAQEFVTSARINSARQDERGVVSFTINLVLNSKLFYYSKSFDNNDQ